MRRRDNAGELVGKTHLAVVLRFIADDLAGVGQTPEIVGVAVYLHELTFENTKESSHQRIIVFGMKMKFDYMVDIGPNSQSEVHRVYYELDDIGVRLSHYIGACGYEARTQPNIGDVPLPAYGWLAGFRQICNRHWVGCGI